MFELLSKKTSSNYRDRAKKKQKKQKKHMAFTLLHLLAGAEPSATAKSASSTGHVLGRRGVTLGREKGVKQAEVMARKRPRLVFDHNAAQVGWRGNERKE